MRKKVSKMWENAYLSIGNPKDCRALYAGPGTQPQVAHFTMLATFGL